TDGVDDQCIPFPMADRVAIETRQELFRMRPAVHVNGSERLWTVFIKYVDGLRFRYIDKLGAARRNKLTRPARRLATCVRLEQVSFAILIERSRPGLERNLTLLRFARKRRTRKSAAPLAVFDRGVGFGFGKNRPAIRMPETLLTWRRAKPRCSIRP